MWDQHKKVTSQKSGCLLPEINSNLTTLNWTRIEMWPAERGWVSENLPRSSRRSQGLRGRFSLIHPSSAGRFIILESICGKVFPDLLSTMFGRFHRPVKIFLTCSPKCLKDFTDPWGFSWSTLKYIWRFHWPVKYFSGIFWLYDNLHRTVKPYKHVGDQGSGETFHIRLNTL